MGQRIERFVLTCLKPSFKKWHIASFHLSVHTTDWNIICLLKKQLFTGWWIISHWKRKTMYSILMLCETSGNFSKVANTMKNLHPRSNYWFFNSTQQLQTSHWTNLQLQVSRGSWRVLRETKHQQPQGKSGLTGIFPIFILTLLNTVQSGWYSLGLCHQISVA